MTTVLPTPAPPNAPTLPPLVNGADQVDHFNSGLKNLRFDVLIRERRRGPMNRIPFCELNRAFVIDRIAGNIENASESSLAYWHGDGATGVVHFHPAL